MTGERAAQALFLLLALLLPLSALVARGLPRGRILRLVLLWVAIFAAVALIAGVLPTIAHGSILHNIYYQIASA